MEWTKENKRNAYLIGGAIIVLFVVLLMLKFWMVSLAGIVCFVLGYYFGRKSAALSGERNEFL
ncbi:hypothetical protein N8987_00760 [Crocinitomix sp.]|nr:hypothetical protein [Crocinitomix sp.]